VLKDSRWIGRVGVTHHTSRVTASLTPTKEQHVGFAHFLPYTNELTTRLL
jgi:hypothetical protein